MPSIEEINVEQLRRLAACGAYMDVAVKPGTPGVPYDGSVTLEMLDGEKITMNARVREEACSR